MTGIDLTELVSGERLEAERQGVASRIGGRERGRRFRHRLVAAAAFVGVAGLVTAGALVLTPPAPPPPLSEEEKSARYHADRELEWARIVQWFPEAERPDVEFEAYIPLDDWPTVMVECLAEQGVDAQVGYDGEGVSTSGDFETGQIAMFVCNGRFPVDPSYFQPWSDDEVLYLYRYYTEVLAPCIQDLGIVPADAPSLEEYRQTLRDGGYWMPIPEMLPREDHVLIYQSCEVSPPGLRP